MRIAITRKVSPALSSCEITHVARQPIDVALAARQHDAYERVLATHGCAVESLAAEELLPDSVFVEDTAIVLAELAVITRPGALSRRFETESIARALSPHRALSAIQGEGTLDGGDVLVLGKRVLVGLSSRTNRDGAEQLRELLGWHGYAVEPVGVTGCLHLKTAVTQVGPEAVLLNPAFIDRALFGGLEVIEVDPGEPHAGNALLLGDVVVYANGYPRTAERLEGAGVQLARVDVSELAKAEAGVTCCSLVFTA